MVSETPEAILFAKPIHKCVIKKDNYKFPLTILKSRFNALHTYIISHHYLSVRILAPVSHTTYIVCVNFIREWRDLQFKVDPERQKLFMAILFTLRVS